MQAEIGNMRVVIGLVEFHALRVLLDDWGVTRLVQGLAESSNFVIISLVILVTKAHAW